MLNKIIEEAKKEFESKFNQTIRWDWAGKEFNDRKKELLDFLSHSLTKGIQKAMEEIKVNKAEIKDVQLEFGWNRYDDYIKDVVKEFYLKGYNQACEELDTKINQLMQ